jgi:predicted RNA-binding Zn ribbon-like protein
LSRTLIDGSAHATDEDLRRALAAREGLRDHARANTDGAAEDGLVALNQAASGAAFEIRFSPTGPRFTPTTSGTVAGAIGLLLAIAGRSMIDGSWPRLKICPGFHCGWAFFDYSRNRTGRWCSMSVCGGRAKARAHYLRRRAGAD